MIFLTYMHHICDYLFKDNLVLSLYKSFYNCIWDQLQGNIAFYLFIIYLRMDWLSSSYKEK